MADLSRADAMIKAWTHLDPRALVRALERVTVNLLEEASPAAKGKHVRAPSKRIHVREDVLELLEVDAVTLNQPDVRRELAEPLLVNGRAKLRPKDLETLDDDLGRVARVRAHDEDALAGRDHLLQGTAPQVLARLPDVVADGERKMVVQGERVRAIPQQTSFSLSLTHSLTHTHTHTNSFLPSSSCLESISRTSLSPVANACNKSFRELREHVAKRCCFVLGPPRCHRAVFRRWDRESGDLVRWESVHLTSSGQCSQSVCAHEVDLARKRIDEGFGGKA